MQKYIDDPKQMKNQKKAAIYQDSQQYQDSQDDDLLAFQNDDKRNKIIKQNNLTGLGDFQVINYLQNSSMTQSEAFNKFYKGLQQEQEKQIRDQKNKNQNNFEHINQQQISAKKLRAFNATKYFQKIKLVFLKQVNNQIKQISSINGDKVNINGLFSKLISKINYRSLIKFHKLRNKNPLAIDIKQVLDLFNQCIIQNILEQPLLQSRFSKKQSYQQKNYYDSLNRDELSNFDEPQNYYQNQRLSKMQILIMIADFLNVKIRKIGFFNIQKFVDESFYNLNYEKGMNIKKRKKQMKKTDQIKTQIQRKIYEQQIQNSSDYVDLSNFSYQAVSNNLSKTQKQIQAQIKVTKGKSKMIAQIKKYFEESTYQIFSCLQNKWKLFIAIEGHYEQIDIQWFKMQILNGLPIIGFHCIEKINTKSQFQNILDLRKMRNIIINDMSMHFCDQWKALAARKRRVGIKILMSRIFRYSHFKKPLQILQEVDYHSGKRTFQQCQQILKNQIPTSKMQFTFSDYFLTPSQVGKYHILSPQAKAIENVEFNQQKLYWKDDLVPVCSRMGWIDSNRMVIQSQIPLKRTQNRNKKSIDLFSYEQTKPFVLEISQDGEFLLDPDHLSIYIPPRFVIPQGTCLLTQRITYICKKHKFRFAKLVQGFKNSGVRVLPNQIGFIIYQSDKQQILKLQKQRQDILNDNKQQRQLFKIQKMWKQLFKYIKLIQRLQM